MATKDRSLPIPYVPAPSPLGDSAPILVRAVWDEFERVAQSLVDLDKPNTMAVRGTENLNVTAAVSWQRLLNSGAVIDYANPGATFNTATGVYTCPQEGIYQVSVTLNAPAFPTPANKEYFVGLRATVDPLIGANRELQSFDGGQDSIPKHALLLTLIRLSKGDTIYADATLVHQTKTGTVSASPMMQIIRMSAA